VQPRAYPVQPRVPFSLKMQYNSV